ncbi:hypothetical protein, partial [Brevundimonas nasdae]|uniref:hypothetical protein n=1 Tax=Brevundimonas nasdae TaxID=172043 RepID=UPI003F692FC4
VSGQQFWRSLGRLVADYSQLFSRRVAAQITPSRGGRFSAATAAPSSTAFQPCGCVLGNPSLIGAVAASRD